MSEVVKLNLWFSPQAQERVDLTELSATQFLGPGFCASLGLATFGLHVCSCDLPEVIWNQI
jgi:hypothetical protein